MKFTKMQGIGNDYVYVNCLEERVEHPSETAIKVSDRLWHWFRRIDFNQTI